MRLGGFKMMTPVSSSTSRAIAVFDFFAALHAAARKMPAGAIAVANEKHARRFIDNDALTPSVTSRRVSAEGEAIASAWFWFPAIEPVEAGHDVLRRRYLHRSVAGERHRPLHVIDAAVSLEASLLWRRACGEPVRIRESGFDIALERQ